MIPRPATALDVPALAALEAALFGRDAWTARALAEEVAAAPTTRTVLVVTAPETRELVAYAVLRLAGATADVDRIGVAPTHRRRGLARLLLRALVADAESRGCAEVLLEVDTDNEAAIRLYETEGFGELTRRPGYYDGGRRDALVLRRLPAPPPPRTRSTRGR